MHDVKFARFGEKPGSAKVAPRLDEVFAGDPAEQATRFAPLLSFDLHDVNPAWQGRAHFVYHEVGSADCLRFRLTDDRYTFLGDAADLNEDAPIEHRPTFRVPPFVELVTVSVPSRHDSLVVRDETKERAATIWGDDERWAEAKKDFLYWSAVDDAAKAVDSTFTTDLLFCGGPRWLQRDATPNDASGQPMAFVGQIQSALFSKEMARVSYYMFFSPAECLVSIVNQMG